MIKDLIKGLWCLLLELKISLAEAKENIEIISVQKKEDGLEIHFNNSGDFICISLTERPLSSQAKIQFLCDELLSVVVVKNEGVDTQAQNLLKQYLPYALLPYFSKRRSKIFSISHFAQTLDGKIACSSGDSKWIGNQENLIHAHRMRALCDAVVVGRGTLTIDQPRLDVRHVEGENPLKIIIGASLRPSIEESDNIIFFSSNPSTQDRSGDIQVSLNQDGTINLAEVLDYLKKKKFCSVYIEGGAFTTSEFLSQGLLSQVQIHIAPKILGSGISGFKFSQIDNIGDAVTFKKHWFEKMGEDVMFVGNCI